MCSCYIMYVILTILVAQRYVRVTIKLWDDYYSLQMDKELYLDEDKVLRFLRKMET